MRARDSVAKSVRLLRRSHPSLMGCGACARRGWAGGWRGNWGWVGGRLMPVLAAMRLAAPVGVGCSSLKRAQRKLVWPRRPPPRRSRGGALLNYLWRQCFWAFFVMHPRAPAPAARPDRPPQCVCVCVCVCILSETDGRGQRRPPRRTSSAPAYDATATRYADAFTTTIRLRFDGRSTGVSTAYERSLRPQWRNPLGRRVDV